MVDAEDINDEELQVATPDRPRGILTRRERGYYLGQSDIERETQAERSLRQSVREHLTHAILDFSILYQELEDRDLDAIMSATVGVDGDRVPTRHVENSAPDLVALLYRHFGQEHAIEQVIADGIARELRSEGLTGRVDVDVDIHDVERISDLAQQDLTEVSDSELEQLRLAGEITREEYATEVVRRKEETMDMEQVREMRRDAARTRDEDGDGQE